MNTEDTIEKKEISEGTAVKAFINGFISYGILFIFIIFMGVAFFNWFSQSLDIKNNLTLTISTSLIFAILLYFSILFLCRISTFDVLKKCKLNTSKLKCITQKMTIFFIGCAIFSLIFCFSFVSIKYKNSTDYIDKVSNDYYNSFKDENIEIANTLTNELISKFKDEWSSFAISLSIIEGTFLFSCFYLIFYQKKMILLYNETEENK